ncbi:MAG: hypothetical protein ACJ76B_10485 [Solirubrobacterales bacterium]
MPSVRRSRQLAVLVLGGTLAVAGLAGCETTQEKAEAQRAESARILKQRDKRQENRNKQQQQRQDEKEKG